MASASAGILPSYLLTGAFSLDPSGALPHTLITCGPIVYLNVWIRLGPELLISAVFVTYRSVCQSHAYHPWTYIEIVLRI